MLTVDKILDFKVKPRVEPSFRSIEQNNVISYERFLSKSPKNISIISINPLTDHLKNLEIVVPDENEVLTYLSYYPDLANPLINVCLKAKELLDSDARLGLKVYRNKEFRDSYLTLYIESEKDYFGIIQEISGYCSEQLLNTKGWMIVKEGYVTDLE